MNFPGRQLQYTSIHSVGIDMLYFTPQLPRIIILNLFYFLPWILIITIMVKEIKTNHALDSLGDIWTK
jgi:hypothetical protein